MKYTFDKETVEQFNNLLESYTYPQDLGYLMNSHYQVCLRESKWNRVLYGKLNDLTMEEFLALNLNNYEVKNSKLDNLKVEYSKHLINSYRKTLIDGESPLISVEPMDKIYSKGYVQGVIDAVSALNTSVSELGLLGD